MAGNVQASSDPGDHEIVNIEDFWKLAGNCLELPFQIRIANQFLRLLDCGRFAFDVSKYFSNLRHVVADVSFEIGYLIVSALEGHTFVEFNMLFDVEFAGEVLNADVVNVQVVPGGDGPNTVEDIFGTLGTRQGLNGNIGVGKDAVHRIGHRCY